MSQERRRQKKLERHRKSRQLAQRKARAKAQASVLRGTASHLLQVAHDRPFGPVYISAGWDDLSLPNLVSCLLSRQLPDGRILPGVALVDRTCLGVKNGFLLDPTSPEELAQLVLTHRSLSTLELCPCEPLLAQSIVFHALDYAGSLGFKPHRDFPAELFGPRPANLLDTPWAHPERPSYMSGPNDDVLRILARLDEAVGRGNYYMTVEAGQLGPAFDRPTLQELEEDEEEDDDGALFLE